MTSKTGIVGRTGRMETDMGEISINIRPSYDHVDKSRSHGNVRREWCSGEPGSPCGPEPGVDDHTIGYKNPGKRSIRSINFQIYGIMMKVILDEINFLFRKGHFGHRMDNAYDNDYNDCISNMPGDCVDVDPHIKLLPCTPGKRNLMHRILGIQCDNNG